MVILYSTNCPKCNILEKRIKSNNIEYKISNDVNDLIDMGFQTAPVLQIDDRYYEFKEAMEYLKSYEKRGMDC